MTTLDDKTLDELREIAGRYPEKRSGLLPMLHLAQSVQGKVTPEAHRGLRRRSSRSPPAEVSGVATFYTMYKRHAGRRLPRRRLHQHAVRGDGRRRDLRPAQGAPRHRQRRGGREAAGRPALRQPRARRVQRGLRLRPGRDGQLGVHGQPDPGGAVQMVESLRAGHEVRSTRGPASAPGARPSGCSPASPTASSTRARPPDRPAWSGSRSRASAAGPRRPPGPGRGRGAGSKQDAVAEADTTRAESETVEETSGSDESAAEKEEAQ